MKMVWMTLVIGLGFVGGAFAGDARSAFEAGNYGEAAKQLETQVGTVAPAAENFYNMGLAYEKAGQPVPAALNFQRALLLDPGLKAARNSFALLAAAQQISLPPRTWLDDLTSVAHPETWIIAGTALAWLGIFGLLMARRAAKPLGPTAFAAIVIVVGGGLVASGCLADRRLSAARPAVVTATDGAEVLAAPANNSSVVVKLPAGSPVGVRSPRGAWAYVTVVGGGNGWVQTDRLTPTVPGERF